MNKRQELIEYIKKKKESLDFWNHLRGVHRLEKKLVELKGEIEAAEKELNLINERIEDN